MTDNLTIKKFLDQEGVSTLWSKIAEKVKTDVAAEATARDNAIAAAIATEVTDRNAAIKVEADRAKEAEKSISDALALAVSDFEGELAAEVSARENADSAINTFIGSLPEGATATTIVGYINEKTNGIATDAALGELQDAVDAIEADYLKAADKTELEGKITAEENRATGIENGLADRIAAIEADYLVEADKYDDTALVGRVAAIEADYLTSANETALNSAIALKVAQADYDAKVEEIKGTTDNLQTQINTIMNNPDTEGVINSINEFTQYIADHGAIADGFRADIDQNKTDIATEASTARAAEEALAGRLAILEAIDHEAYIAADTALKNELTGEINKKADASALTQEIADREAADAALSGRLAAVEGLLTGGEGSVGEQIEAAKQEAIDAAADALAEAKTELEGKIADAATNAANMDAVVLANAQAYTDTAKAEAKTYADGLNTTMDGRVSALEAIGHEHANKALLDSYTQTEANLADAVAKKHSHSNLEVLEGITATKVSAWDAAEQNAKDYAKSYTNSVFNEKILALTETEILDAITAASAK